MLKQICILIYLLFAFIKGQCQETIEHASDSLNNQDKNYNFQNFNFKNGKKENGVYFHFYRSSEFKTELNQRAKTGFYVVTEFKTDFNLIKEEAVRYFNFGFPESDFISFTHSEMYFLYVYYSENKEIALQKLHETKMAGVPHVWINVLEE